MATELRETNPINMDIFVHMPCQWVTLINRDSTGDQRIVANEVSMEEVPFFIPTGTVLNKRNQVRTPELDEILAEAIPGQFREKMDFGGEEQEYNACHIFGSVPVNMVTGSLLITASGRSARDMKSTPAEIVNLSHVINELSFGEFYPYIDNPLDSTARVSQDGSMSYHYFTSVAPTTFKKLGAVVKTNQYSVSETEHKNPPAGLLYPAIVISYNFEALTITISDERISFWKFIVRLVAILSFIVYILTWAFAFTDMLLVAILGPKWSLRYQRHGQQKSGLLE